jgi:transcriptional regulator
MYIPPANRVTDPRQIAALIRRYSFATVVTQENGGLCASHLPVLHHADSGPRGTLVSHMARQNPQWQQLERGAEALVIFQGPHAYISPSWYEPQMTVPTWNYAVVHAYGIPRLITDHSSVLAVLEETVATFEAAMPEPWEPEFSVEYRDRQINAIVAFEIAITRLEAKFKLGQNRSEADYRGMYEALASAENSTSRGLAELMLEVRPLEA